MNNSRISGGVPAAVLSGFPRFSIAMGVALFLIANVAHAQYGPDDEAEALEAMKPKAEAEAKLPPLPNLQDMLPVDTGPTARQTFAIEQKSLTVSPDHIIRYTVVATSSSGSQNVSYEGIDCKSKEFKRYAYASKDGKWTRSRSDKWVKVSSMSQNQLHYVLYSLFFCQGGAAIGNPPDILDRIRYNRVINN